MLRIIYEISPSFETMLKNKGLRDSKYGSESEFRKPNRYVPNYFSNSEKSEFRLYQISELLTFYWIFKMKCFSHLYIK
jgi:hypothetical protein